MTILKTICKWGFLLFAKMGALLLPRLTSSNYLDRVHRILVYADMGIGNMILFTPTLQAIRNQFPEAKISLLIGKSGCDQVVECSSLVDEVLRVKYSLFEIVRLANVIRKKRFDLLISSFLSGSKYLTLLTIFSWLISLALSKLFSCRHAPPYGFQWYRHVIGRPGAG